MAMDNEFDIEFDMPISERLSYQLRNHYIPVIDKYVSFMHAVDLIGPVENVPIENEGAVGTGCSGGVDSFYTIVTHTGEKVEKSNCLTHLVFSSSGTLDSPEHEDRIQNNYITLLADIRKISEEANLELVACYNNIHHFYNFPYKIFCEFYATIYAASVFALQKLFSVYYESSDWPISEFDITMKKNGRDDFCINDIFSLQMINTENLTFYSVGECMERTDKIHAISDNRIANKYLNVCGRRYETDLGDYYNCGECPKCVNTMTILDIDRKLDKFEKLFNMSAFRKKPAKTIAKMMVMKEKRYITDLLAFAKRNGYKFPHFTGFWRYCVYTPYNFLRIHLRKSNLAKKIYYKLNIDYKLHGFRNAKAEDFVKKTSKK